MDHISVLVMINTNYSVKYFKSKYGIFFNVCRRFLSKKAFSISKFKPKIQLLTFNKKNSVLPDSSVWICFKLTSLKSVKKLRQKKKFFLKNSNQSILVHFFFGFWRIDDLSKKSHKITTSGNLFENSLSCSHSIAKITTAFIISSLFLILTF